MKFSEAWLREWANPNNSTNELAEQLTLAGLEVDSVATVVPHFSGVVIGRVEAVEPHPDAEKLRVCIVDVGAPEKLQIVCGAANVRPGLKVPVSVIGAVLPGNFKIKRSKLRGVESFGMICSESELGLAETSNGIMELPEDSPVGKDFRQYFNLEDHVIDIDLTPNRGDCLSILGLAREVAAINELETPSASFEKAATTSDAKISVKVTAGEACPRYLARKISGLKKNQVTPVWMQEKLRRSDIRSINPLVDITNFVMLELGQPLHAFDYDRLNGGIEVRLAKDNEKITLLDGREVALNASDLVIADDKQALALAGIHGGLHSGIAADTENLVLESAYFNPNTISRTARRLGIFTDSSQRFEKGVDYNLQERAMERATQLIVEILGGEVGPITACASQSQLPQQPVITVRANQIERLLGLTIAPQKCEEIFKRLDFQAKSQNDGWLITPPSHRFDITTEIDVIEEIARVNGYHKIPSQPLVAALSFQSLPEERISIERIRALLVDRGYFEAITYSFVDPVTAKAFEPQATPIELLNPISSDLSVMRTNHWPGLMNALKSNEKRQQPRIRLFEIGMCFEDKDGDIRQTQRIGGVVSGSIMPEQWGEKVREVDFYDLKNDLHNLFELGQQDDLVYKTDSHPALHPGKSAGIYKKGTKIGVFGALHPELYQKLDIKNNVYLFDLNLESVLQTAVPQYTKISKFPLIRRDIALLVKKDIKVQQILEKILDSSGDLLKNVHVFDVYEGKGIEPDKKSVALGLIFQHAARTLVDAEINDFIHNLVNTLKTEFNVTLRD